MVEKENYFELIELSNEIFKSTYQYDNETIDQLWLRVGSHLASVEKEKEYYSQQFYNVLKKNRIFFESYSINSTIAHHE